MQTEGLLGGPNPAGMGLRDGGPQSRVGSPSCWSRC